MMNFDKLPSNIKRKIFDCNREAAQIENNKKRYDEVLQELLDSFYVQKRDEDGESIDGWNHHNYRIALRVINYDEFEDYAEFLEEQRQMWCG